MSSLVAKLFAQGPLTHFVEHVRVVADIESAQPYVRLPDGRIELVLTTRHSDVSINVAGTRLTPLRKRSQASSESILVRFKPGGAYPFFGVPLCELTDQVVRLDALLGPEDALRRALEASTPSARVAAVQHALACCLAQPSFEPASVPMVRRALRVLAAPGPLPSVEQLALDLGVSARHLRRAFADVVGVTPKEYLRIVRFQRVLRMARARPSEPWARLAQAHGYYDQAHLVSEVRALSGLAPGSLR
jgi:AraC-like DNA-binding protein